MMSLKKAMEKLNKVQFLPQKLEYEPCTKQPDPVVAARWTKGIFISALVVILAIAIASEFVNTQRAKAASANCK
jgi:hypothetical protein